MSGVRTGSVKFAYPGFTLPSVESPAVFAAPTNRTLLDVQRLADAHLSGDDLSSFRRATGFGVSDLLEFASAWVQSQPDPAAADLVLSRAIMSTCPLFAHPLNDRGLHPLRALLGARVSDARRERWGSARHPLFTHFARDGILVFPNVAYTQADARHATSDVPSVVVNILQMVSGYRHVPGEWSQFATHIHHPRDAQYYMHVDTLHPSWKVFVFPPDTSLANGPFFFSNGTHGAHSVGKLRWLFDRTRAPLHLRDPTLPKGMAFDVNSAAAFVVGEDRKKRNQPDEKANEKKDGKVKGEKMPDPNSKSEKKKGHRARRKAHTKAPKTQRSNQEAAGRRLQGGSHSLEGRYVDASHSPSGMVEPAIRFLGFDPRIGGRSVQALLDHYGFAPPTPIEVEAAATGPTLVIADTSGLHFRGFATPGKRRTYARLEGSGGGCGGCLPRKNVFVCELEHDLC